MMHRTRGPGLASHCRAYLRIAIALVAGVLSVNGGMLYAENYDEFFRKCYDNSNADQAIVACSVVITKQLVEQDDLAAALKNRGNAYDDKGQYDRALEDYNQALTIKPDDAATFNSRGTTHSAMGHYDLAIRDYDQAIKLNPASVMAFNNRCFAKALAGQGEQALADCNESLRIKPKNPGALASRGFVYLKLKRYEAAMVDYDAELRVSPGDPYSLFGRGIAKLIRGDLRGGDADIVAAQAIRPDIADHMAKLGIQLGNLQ
jgi:tetratricopeptide (TPR) repeat protein